MKTLVRTSNGKVIFMANELDEFFEQFLRDNKNNPTITVLDIPYSPFNHFKLDSSNKIVVDEEATKQDEIKAKYEEIAPYIYSFYSFTKQAQDTLKYEYFYNKLSVTDQGRIATLAGDYFTTGTLPNDLSYSLKYVVKIMIRTHWARLQIDGMKRAIQEDREFVKFPFPGVIS